MNISNGIDKEVFVINEYGFHFDIETLINDINKNKVEHETLELNIEQLLTFVRTDIQNKNAISSMSEKRKNEPLIVTNIGDKNRIIDGNHRLIRRKNDGETNCSVVFVSSHLLEAYLLNA